MSMKADKALSTFCFCLVAINAMFSSNRGRMSPGLDFTSCLNILTINHPSLCKTHPPSVIVQTHNPHNHLSLCKYITSTICYCANTITLTICHSANTFTINHLSLYKHIHHQLLYKHIHHKPSTAQTYSHQWLLEIISITLPETASPDALKIDMGEFNHCPLKVFSTSYFQHVDCPTRKDCILDLCYTSVGNADFPTRKDCILDLLHTNVQNAYSSVPLHVSQITALFISLHSTDL